MAANGITFAIEALDKFSAPFAAFNRRLAESTSGLRRLGSRMSALDRETGLARLAASGRGVVAGLSGVAAAGRGLLAKAAGIGGLAALGLKKGFIDVAAEFERFTTVLNTLNHGDMAKSKGEMSWISDFAAKTPYELGEVTAAFVKLRSYGLDPMHGLLRTLGDTASGMGKGLDQAVEAIADAVTGQNERLKEFGITANQAGGKIVYGYTDAAGKQTKMMVKAGDRMAIQATLMKIWSEKFGGGMAAQSRTFGGMLSNLSDAWTRIAGKIMEFGGFDFLKAKLQGILSLVDRLSQNGRLDAWAKRWGTTLTQGLENAWRFGKGLAGGLARLGRMLAWTAGLMGGWKNLGLALAALMGVQFVLAATRLAASIAALGATMLTTPIGWISLGLLALGGIVYAAVRHTETFVKVLGGLAVAFGLVGAVILSTPIGWFSAAIGAVAIGIMGLVTHWRQFVGWVAAHTPKWILRLFGGSSPTAPASGAPDAGSGPSAKSSGWSRFANSWNAYAAGAFNTPGHFKAAGRPVTGAVGGPRSTSTGRKETHVTVDFKNVPRGTRIRQSGAPLGTGVNYALGPNMAY